MRFAPVLAFLTAIAGAQTVTDPGGPDISAYYRLPGFVKDLVKYPDSDGYPYAWLRIDRPLTFTVDPAGRPHLGTAAPRVMVRGDVPAPVGAGWQLAGVPVAGATCFRNGIRQSAVDTPSPAGLVMADYRLQGNTISAIAWGAGDVLACDYETAGP